MVKHGRSPIAITKSKITIAIAITITIVMVKHGRSLTTKPIVIARTVLISITIIAKTIITITAISYIKF